VGVRALTEDGHDGRKYVLTGPELLTKAEQVRAIGEAIGRPLRFEEIPMEEARQKWIAAGLPSAVVDGIFTAHAWFVEEPGLATTTVEEVTGTPARTFREWALDHTGDFRNATKEGLAGEYVSLFRKGNLKGATKLLSEGFTRAEQTEPFGPPVELRGEEVRRNMERNIEEEEIHAFEVDGPFVGGTPAASPSASPSTRRSARPASARGTRRSPSTPWRTRSWFARRSTTSPSGSAISW